MKKLFSTVFITIMAFGFAKAQTVLYSEDFSGGLPASWSNTGTSQGSPNAHVKFVYTHGSGSGGHYGSTYGTISSPTVANGYITFDSDSLDESTGSTQGAGLAPSPQHVELSIPGINVAGHPKMRLQFYQDLALFQGTAAVAISNDSINWTIDTLDAAQQANTATAVADQKVSIDISSIVNNQPTVYIRFILDLDYYFWSIDDISLIELPSNDLEIKSFAGQSLTSQGLGLFFSAYPASQNDSVTPVVVYGNIGRTDQPNCVAQISLAKNGTPLGTTYVTNPPVALLPSNVDTIDFVTLATAGIGAYTSSVYVHSDSTDFDPSNNVDTLNFNITDSVFSINQGSISGTVYFLLRNNFGASFRTGTLFEVIHPDTVTSVTTSVIGGSIGNITLTRPGAIIQASIYQMTVSPTSLTYSTPSVSTFPRTLAAGDIGSNSTFKTVNLKIDNSTGNAVLQPGIYWVAIKGVSTPDSNIAIVATEYQTNGIPIIEDNAQPGQLSLLSSTDAAFCNMNFGRSTSLLYADFTRNPGITPLHVGQIVTFTGITNGGPTSSTYTWDFTPGYAAGQNGVTYPQRTGKIIKDTLLFEDTINVCLTVTDGGASAQTCKSVRVRANGVGVQEVSPLDNISMVPNPTTGKVTISADGMTGATTISITNMIGEQVKSYNETVNSRFSKTYDISDLSSGLYIVRIANGGNSVSTRLSLTK